MGPSICLGPGAISMKEDWVQGAPLHSHTQTSYAGTRAFMRHRARVALFLLGLLLPYAVVWATKYPRGGKGLRINYQSINFYIKESVFYLCRNKLYTSFKTCDFQCA